MKNRHYFTYPVLSEGKSGYKKECTISLNCGKPYFENSIMIIPYKVYLNCKTIRSLIDSNKAYINIIIRSSYYAFSVEVVSMEGDLKIDTEKLVNDDNIHLNVEVHAKESQTIKNQDEFIHIYESDYEFDVEKNDVLAISKKKQVEYKRGTKSFFIFRKNDELSGEGIEFKCEDDLISISMGEELLESILNMKGSNEKYNLYLLTVRMLIIQAIISGLIQLQDHFDDYEESRWKDEFIFAYNRITDGDLKEYLDSVTDDRIELLHLAQKMFSELIKEHISIEEFIISLDKE